MYPELMFNEHSIFKQVHAKSENGFIVLLLRGMCVCMCVCVGLYISTLWKRVCVSDQCLQESAVSQTSVSINVFLL